MLTLGLPALIPSSSSSRDPSTRSLQLARRLSKRDRARSQDRIRDHLHHGTKTWTRLASDQPKPFWIHAYFPASRGGTSRRPPRDSASPSARPTRSSRS